MLLKEINSTNHTNLIQTNKFNAKKNNSATSKKTQLTNDTVSSSIKKLSNIIKNNDIKNINSQELLNLSHNLFEEGVISFETHAFLTLRPEIESHPYYSKLSGFNGEPDVSKNIMQEWKDLYEQQKKEGASDTILNNTKAIVEFIENYDSLRSSLINQASRNGGQE